MPNREATIAGLLLLAMAAPLNASGPGRSDPTALLAAQREAMSRLAVLDGAWRGSARTLGPSGEWHSITQTERVGPFLEGSLKVIEGRGYEADGNLAFNALGIISFDPDTHEYTMRSYAQGHAGDFPLTLTEDGFRWEIPAGPMTMRYTAVVKDGTWTEVGERVLPEKQAVRFLEMRLERVGDTDWPSAGAVTPR